MSVFRQMSSVDDFPKKKAKFKITRCWKSQRKKEAVRLVHLSDSLPSLLPLSHFELLCCWSRYFNEDDWDDILFTFSLTKKGGRNVSWRSSAIDEPIFQRRRQFSLFSLFVTFPSWGKEWMNAVRSEKEKKKEKRRKWDWHLVAWLWWRRWVSWRPSYYFLHPSLRKYLCVGWVRTTFLFLVFIFPFLYYYITKSMYHLNSRILLLLSTLFFHLRRRNYTCSSRYLLLTFLVIHFLEEREREREKERKKEEKDIEEERVTRWSNVPCAASFCFSCQLLTGGKVLWDEPSTLGIEKEKHHHLKKIMMILIFASSSHFDPRSLPPEERRNGKERKDGKQFQPALESWFSIFFTVWGTDNEFFEVLFFILRLSHSSLRFLPARLVLTDPASSF